MSSRVGPMLRHWRGVRRLSQLDLSLLGNVSQRHLSFVETGRSQPSRQLLLHLARVLELPLRDRNALLHAAGYAPSYPATDWDDPAVAPVRRAVELLLERHDPAPAVVLDRRWDLVTANRSAASLVATLAGPDAVARAGGNAMRLLVAEDGLRPTIVNWDEAAAELAERIRTEAAAYPDDADLAALAAELLEAIGPLQPRRPDQAMELLVPLHFRAGDLEVRTFSMLATVGSALDVTLSELVVELFHPADQASAAALECLAGQPPAVVTSAGRGR